MADDVQVEDAISAIGTDLTGTRSAVEELPPPKTASYDSVPPISSYQIKPTLQDK